jgi:hypothetical protein
MPNNKGIRLSAFAEKYPGVKDSRSCLNHYVPESYQKKLGSKTVGIMESDMITSIYYRPYYKGYCFDFHFSANNKEGIDKISKIIDSIQFVDGSFSKASIKKFIYYSDKRIQLLIPDNYVISYNSGTRGSIPSIVLRPKNGKSFKMNVSIFTSKTGSPIPKENIRRNAQLQMADIAKNSVNEPKLMEIAEKETTVYYYVAEDKNYKPSNKEEYPFLCQGYAAVDGSVLYFTILYREAGQEISNQGLDIIANARILNLQ